MERLSDSALNLFEAEYDSLAAMVSKRIQLEWRYHPGRNLDKAGFQLLDYALQFGQMLQVLYRYDLIEALNEEARWYAAMFSAHGWGRDAFTLLLDSWIVGIQGLIKPPECNELAGPLKTLKREAPGLFDAARDKRAASRKVSEPLLVEYLLQGDIQNSRRLLCSMHEFSKSPDQLIVKVLLPTMSDIGDRWERHQIEIFQEHFATEALRSLLASLPALLSFTPKPTERTALVSCAPGDTHALISLALSSYLEIRGWRVKNLGGSLPAEQIIRAVETSKPDTLFLSFTMVSRLTGVLDVIERMRLKFSDCTLIVGGRGTLYARSLLESKGVLVANDFEHGYRLATRKQDHA
jgi:methanogenic corrinoid protein MtbC1